MKKAFIVIFLMATISHANAQTYYVSPSGNDINNGLTIGTSFLTLQHASDIVQPGDTVQVLAGNYVGFYHTTSGTSTNPIVFTAQPNVLINQPNTTTDDGINLEGASYVIVEGFNVYGMPRTGIRSVINDHVIIRNNTCDSCYRWGILTGFSEDIVIENNLCSRSVDEHGIYFGNSADNPIIRNNVSWDNNACGIHMNADASLGGDGITSNALVENNLIYNNGVAGGSGINCDGVQSSRIQNNLLYNNHASGISLYMIDAAEGAKNNVVVNNTILQAADARWALNISDGSSGNTAFNNIFYSDHAFRGSISIDDASMTNFKSNYNVLVDRLSNDGGSSNMTLAQWQNLGLDSNSVMSTPVDLFLNPMNDNYHLSVSSPAKELGRMSYYSIAAPATDMETLIRPVDDFPDAGAYEFFFMNVKTIAKQSITTWYSLSVTDNVLILDLSGREIFNGNKSEFDNLRQRLGGMFVFQSCNENRNCKYGWVQGLK